MHSDNGRPVELRFHPELTLHQPRTPDTRSPFEYGTHLGYDHLIQCQQCPAPLAGSRRFCDTHRRAHADGLLAQVEDCRTAHRARLDRLRTAGWLNEDGVLR